MNCTDLYSKKIGLLGVSRCDAYPFTPLAFLFSKKKKLFAIFLTHIPFSFTFCSSNPLTFLTAHSDLFSPIYFLLPLPSPFILSCRTLHRPQGPLCILEEEDNERRR